MRTSDTSTGIEGVGPFHVVAGIHIGAMGILPARHQIASILTVAARPGLAPDHVSHRHIPLSYQNLEREDLDEAVKWVLEQLQGEHAVLIRSERGRQRPGLVAALAIVHLGGRFFDANSCVKRANPDALTDFRYLEILRATDLSFNAPKPKPRLVRDPS